MPSILRHKISTRLASVLNNLQLVKSDEADFIHKKLDFYTKLERVDKSSKKHGIYNVHLNKLNECFTHSAENLLPILNKELTNVRDDIIESCCIDKSFKLIIKVHLHELKKATFRTIFQEKSQYGFVLNDEAIYHKTANIYGQFGAWSLKKQPSVTLVEFSSPNIAKPLHAGHMRSTFLGNFLSNIHERYEHPVHRINYLGDWGTQYGLLAVGFEKYGDREKLNASPIKHLLDVYVKANKDDTIRDAALKYFADLESQKEENLETWKLFKDLSIKELEQIYEKLNIKFSVYESESQHYPMAKEIVQKLLEKGIAHRLNNSAVQVQVTPPHSKKQVQYIAQKGDGSTLYITRDIAAFLERKKKYNFSKILYVVDSSQRDHFYRLYETLRAYDSSLLKNISFEEFYVPFGRLTNMSTRRGQVEFLSDLVDEAKQVALEAMEVSKNKRVTEDKEKVAQIIGNSHLIVSDLSRPRIKDYEFSWSNIVSKDESAYMCHYSHARLSSLLDKCRTELHLEPALGDIDVNKLDRIEELSLIQHLARFDEVVWQSFQDNEPYHIVQYMYQLVHLTNSCLKNSYVIGENDQSVALSRLCLYYSARQVIANALTVIGVTPLDKM